MADTREIFSILENADGSGEGLSNKQIGDAAAGANEAPVLSVEDSSGNMQHVKTYAEGDTAAVEGQPAFTFKDSSGNLVYPSLDADGKIPVSSADVGTTLQSLGDTAVGVVSTAVEVSVLALTISEEYVCSLGVAACSKMTKWEMIHDDNSTLNVLETKFSGPGDFNTKFELKAEFTAGGAGTQRLIIRGTQLRGPATDLYSSVKVIQKA